MNQQQQDAIKKQMEQDARAICPPEKSEELWHKIQSRIRQLHKPEANPDSSKQTKH